MAQTYRLVVWTTLGEQVETGKIGPNVSDAGWESAC